MGRTKKSKKATKPKAKAKKEVQIVPKLRLEPRLKPKPSKKAVDKAVPEDSPNLSKIDEKGETSSVATSSSCFPSKEIGKDSEQEVFNLLYNSTVNEAKSLVASSSSEPLKDKKVFLQEDEASKVEKDYEQEFEAPTVETQTLMDWTFEEVGGEVDDDYNPLKKRKKNLGRSYDWDDRELVDLSIGLQNKGFADLKQVADFIKTKNENDVREYIKKRCFEERKAENPYRKLGTWNTVSPEILSKWPNIRKWRKLAYEQMLSHARSKDYSKPGILALCKKFYEEEAEPADPQVINVKMVYKYMMDCMAGEIPSQLPPKESALVLDLLREVRLMPLAYDFEEELKFLKGFKEATKFRPFQVKDEFKKRFKKSHNDEALGPNTVSVPEEVFMDLSRHKKLIQSFNPLVAPVWMLQKEQEVFEKYIEESAVYVDQS